MKKRQLAAALVAGMGMAVGALGADIGPGTGVGAAVTHWIMGPGCETDGQRPLHIGGPGGQVCIPPVTPTVFYEIVPSPFGSGETVVATVISQ